MKVTVICRNSAIFYRFGNDQILPRNLCVKLKSMETKKFVIN